MKKDYAWYMVIALLGFIIGILIMVISNWQFAIGLFLVSFCNSLVKDIVSMRKDKNE